MKHLYIKTFWFFWTLAFVLAPVSLFMGMQQYAREPYSNPLGGIMLMFFIVPFFFLIHLALLVPTFIAAKRGDGLVTHKGFKAITCSVCIGISLIGSLPVIATSLPVIATDTRADPSRSVGEWNDCKENTVKCAYTGDGSKYVGEWKDNKKHGQGTYTWANGNKYVGEWKDDKKHGQGTHTKHFGGKYVGEWKNDRKHGQGTYTWLDGNKYVGEWKDGKHHGQGTYTMSLGSVLSWGLIDGSYEVGGYAKGGKYVGEWKDGKLWEGTSYDKDGNVIATY